MESRLSDPGGTRDLASVHSHIRIRPLLHARLHGLPSCQICQHIHAAARSSASPRMEDGHATYRLHGRAANHSSTLDKRLAKNIQMSFLTSPDSTKEFQARTCQLLDTAVREQRMTPESVLDRESRPRPTTTSGLFEAGLGGQGAGISESIHLICWEAKHEQGRDGNCNLTQLSPAGRRGSKQTCTCCCLATSNKRTSMARQPPVALPESKDRLKPYSRCCRRQS